MPTPIRVRLRRALLAATLIVVVVAGTAVVLLIRTDHSAASSGADGRPTRTLSPSGRPAQSSTSAQATPTPISPGPTFLPTPSRTPSAVPDYRQVLGLGDSVTAGTNCNCNDFVTDLAAQLAEQQHTDVGAVNRGVPGATAADLLSDLGSDAALRQTVRDSDVIAITIGANDLEPALNTWESSKSCGTGCYQPQVDGMQDNLDRVIQTVQQLRGDSPTAVLVTDYWNVFADGAVAVKNEGKSFLGWSDEVTRAANTAICRAAQGDDVPCVDLYTPFKGTDGSRDPTDLLADDGDHPNPAGTHLIADALYRELEPTSSGALQR